MRRLCKAVIWITALATLQIAWTGSSQANAQWQPEAPKYGYGMANDVDIRMDDGMLLSADVYFPTDIYSGRRPAGKFPVLLEQTPYGRNIAAFARTASYFVSRGYLIVVADQRGFGKSHGQAAWFGARIGKERLTSGRRARRSNSARRCSMCRPMGASQKSPTVRNSGVSELTNLTGGIYTIVYGGKSSSVINLSIASDADLAASAKDWGPKD